ncbi:uncharacterized protein L3040_004415 [Drepanopeziza brunnea f. sp. 'multigermtubi']|uniref:DUF7730 domain-containing protein n=1 Tax=Marssonina brunnea f. sp. multigermtubi (strain MB_m1) TaxID=1072389 RepID=K1WXW0_MARBU|nr:uncharacterized protein MBM_03648 [Drepanopeziza brunnea f. sp. 'multigermtubi' MB_m1]EKD17876.1 hypothetical protein MBM_03648 [Drepanopeziza brunnea f. sp. 'multigermtubi' MB_m1]KAJ5043027.1 hypothetical protein L3040_004415 [Drepanopeziza brunnea f. sp. 'multigermtubi']
MRKKACLTDVVVVQRGLRPASLSPVLPNIKKRKRRPLLNLPNKGYFSKRRPAFDAFEVKQQVSDNEGNTLKKIRVVSPETGIHSKAWALQIAEQTAPLLRIPIELRQRIFEIVLSDYDLTLTPHKCGKRFLNIAGRTRYTCRSRHDSIDVEDPNYFRPNSVVDLYIYLSMLCRQTYVEIVGGAWLYQIGAFNFNSPTLMYNYINRINPFHASNISAIHLRVRLTRNAPNIPRKIITTLASLQPSLRDLSFEVYVEADLCYELKLPNYQYKFLEHHEFLPKEDICVKLESSKNWELLQNLRSFEMAFCGSYRLLIDSHSPRLIAVREEIKKVVTRAAGVN